MRPNYIIYVYEGRNDIQPATTYIFESWTEELEETIGEIRYRIMETNGDVWAEFYRKGFLDRSVFCDI